MVAVLTYKDVAGTNRVGIPPRPDQPVLADEKVRHRGDPVALVLAESKEALAAEGEMHPVQKAFVDHGAVQCGFCTPGMVLAAVDLLRRNPCPDRQEIRRGLSGNICRCTGYQKIVDAVEAASRDTGDKE